MQLTRRSVLAGLALSGVLAPATYFGARKINTFLENRDGTPPPARVESADLPVQRLSSQLRGIWNLTVIGPGDALSGLSAEGMELFLDTVREVTCRLAGKPRRLARQTRG